MSIFPEVFIDKHCLIYCGDDRCNCYKSPRYKAQKKVTMTDTQKDRLHKVIYLVVESKEHGIYSWCEDDIDGDDLRYVHKSVLEEKDAKINELEARIIEFFRVMETCGPNIYTHVMGTDDNCGQRLRDLVNYEFGK